jgi:hypothetical protein
MVARGFAMDDRERGRTLDYFERLGVERVRLYSRIDCERFLGGWQVRELAEEWLAAQDAQAQRAGLLRRLIDGVSERLSGSGTR